MPDLYLQALMQGQVLKKSAKAESLAEKNRFQIETEKQIDAYIASLPEDEHEFSPNQLISPEIKRLRLKEELKEEAKLSELSQFVITAFQIIVTEGSSYLSAEESKTLMHDFEQGNEALENIDLSIPQNENFQTLLHLSDSTIESILKIAIAKFNDKQYSSSLSLFILLATLIPENPDYWHRAGVVAQTTENYALATRLYQAAIGIDNTMVSPHVFLVDCYLKQGMPEEADTIYKEAIKICEDTNVDPSWKVMLSQYQILLKKS